MKKILRELMVCICFVLLLTGAGWAWAGAESAPAFERDVVVLFTSDVHCGIDQGFGYGGLQAIRDALEAQGDQVLLADNGDAVQGEAIGLLTQGQAIVDLMNQMRYDVAIPGNHEFDYGMERFLALAERAEFPYICCNLNQDDELLFDPYIILERGGVKIGFVGVDTPESITTSTPTFFQDEDGRFIYNFMQGNDGVDLYAAIQTAVDNARAEGADYVILLAHLGNAGISRPYTYADVIEHTRGIDAVLDGHSHDTDKVVMKNMDGEEVVRQACGTKMQGVGWARISAADGSLDTGLYVWNNNISAPLLLGIRNEMTDRVDEAIESMEEDLSRVIGVTSEGLTINDPEAVDDAGAPIRLVRRAETNLGDLIADAIRVRSGAQVAVICGGSVRTDISRGPITLKDVLAVFPFGNRVFKAEVTGRQILDALEWGARSVPEQSGGFLQVSGMSYEIRTDIQSSCAADENGMFVGVTGEYRVQNVLVAGEPLQMDKVYTLASQNYTLVNHGDGHTAFDGARTIWQSDAPDYDLVADYILEDLGGVVGAEYSNPYGQGRIVAVSE